MREQFEQWLTSMEYSERFKHDVLSYLTRYVTEIRSPLDVISLFSKAKRGKRHLVMALRILFKFYEAIGYDKAFLNALRKALPKVKCGIDLKIPSEADIVDSLRKLPKAPLKYQALYNLLIDSGLRLVEAVELIRSFKNAEFVNGFYRNDLFAIPPEVHAQIINDKPSGDVYRLRNVTPEDVTSILKCVYGEDFESLAAQGLELRKKGAQGSGISSK